MNTAGERVRVSRQGADGRLVTTEFNLRKIQDGKIADPVCKKDDRIELTAANKIPRNSILQGNRSSRVAFFFFALSAVLANSVYNGSIHRQPMKLPSTSLIHVLIGKSIIETILVGSLAVIAFLSVLPPYFQGWSEATDYGIAGWAIR